MVKLPELNRHVVGLSAVTLAILALGYGASAINWNSNRPIARLAESGAARVEQMANNIAANVAPNTATKNAATNAAANTAPSTAANSDFFAMLRQVPPNAFGSAAGTNVEPSQNAKTAVAPKTADARDSFASEARNWSEEDWRIATQAVAHSRSKPQARNMSGLSWAPPQEISGRGSSSNSGR